MSVALASILLLGGIGLGLFAVRGVAPDRVGALVTATGLLSSLLIAAALVVATEATIERAHLLGLLAVMVGAMSLIGGFTALALGDPGDDA